MKTWGGPWLGKVTIPPPAPSTGTFVIPLVSVSGFAAAMFMSGTAGDKTRVTEDSWTDATFSATEIALDGAAPILVSALPAGFAVTGASYQWGHWSNSDDLGTLPGSLGIIFFYGPAGQTFGDEIGSLVLPWLGGEFNNVSDTQVIAGSPALEDLLGYVLYAKQTLTYGPTYPIWARVVDAAPLLTLRGTYEVVV